MRLAIILILPLALSGCLAKTALQAVTLPVKAASAGLDAVTTSQAEADQARGRAVRKREECVGREAQRARRQNRVPDYSRCPAG
jgi:hypothetical protein